MDIPAGMRLRFAGAATDWGGVGLFGFVDEVSGSSITINATTGEETHREIAEASDAETISAQLDTIASSIRRQP
jgi:hypothetical protein